MKKIIKDRGYQLEAVSNFKDLLLEDKTEGLLEMATGTGKTITSALCIIEFEKIYGEHKHIFIVPKNTILHNIKRDYESVFPNKKIGIWCHDQKDQNFDILISTFQSLSTKRVIEEFKYIDFGMLIFDEAHHSLSSSYDIIRKSYKNLFNLYQTATPFVKKEEKELLKDLASGNLIYRIDLFESIIRGYLCSLKYKTFVDYIGDGKEVGKIMNESAGEDYKQVLVQKYSSSKERNRHIVKTIREQGILDKHKNFLIYCYTNEHIQNTLAVWKEEGIIKDGNYAFVSKDKTMDDREQIIEDFETGKVKYLFSIRTLTEGVDLPASECILNLAPTKSKVLFFQKLGRVLRTNEGKTAGFVYDFTFDYEQRKRIKQWIEDPFDETYTRISNAPVVRSKKIEITKTDVEDYSGKENKIYVEESEEFSKFSNFYDENYDGTKEEYIEICQTLFQRFGKVILNKSSFEQKIPKKLEAKPLWFNSKNIIKKFGTWINFINECVFLGESHKKDEEEKKSILKNFLPFYFEGITEINYRVISQENKVLPEMKILLKIFGSWKNFIELAHTYYLKFGKIKIGKKELKDELERLIGVYGDEALSSTFVFSVLKTYEKKSYFNYFSIKKHFGNWGIFLKDTGHFKEASRKRETKRLNLITPQIECKTISSSEMLTSVSFIQTVKKYKEFVERNGEEFFDYDRFKAVKMGQLGKTSSFGKEMMIKVFGTWEKYIDYVKNTDFSMK